MALDALFLKDLYEEFAPQIENLRIEKVQMPAKDQVILTFRGNKKLLLSCNPNQARIHITNFIRENPLQPPMFCMLLRKYIGNGLVISVKQVLLDRVITIRIQATDEMGEIKEYSLIAELLGRHSNIVLVDCTNHIIDSVHHVDFDMCSERQVLPGLLYQYPIKKNLYDLSSISRDDFFELLPSGEVDTIKWFTSHFVIAPLYARELLFRAYGDERITSLNSKIWNAIAIWQKEDHHPNILTKNSKMIDFSNTEIFQYGLEVSNERKSSYSSLLDCFYEEKEKQEKVRTRGQELIRTTNNLINRTKKKIALQEKDLEATKNREQYKLYGELLTANLYRFSENCSSVVCQNYYDPELKEIVIPLDIKLSPQKNANRYFKLYTKAKTAEVVLTQRIEQEKQELQYLESVFHEIQMAELEQDFREIRQELVSEGYIKKRAVKEQKGKGSNPRQFITSQGLLVLVGRNNQMNEKLSLKMANKRDIWFHTKGFHGSHVLLCVEDDEPNEVSMYQAAMIAAYYSQGREAGKVSVDYTQAKYLKKPSGGYPGMVIYHSNQTIDVIVNEKEVKELEKC